MKRKTSKKPSAIWSFGALEPTTGLSLLRDQLGGALWYWNALVKIERERRREVEEIEKTIDPMIVDIARMIRKQAKADAKANPDNAKAIRQQVKVRFAALPGYEKIEKVNRAANTQVKIARAASRLHFGTYLLVEKAHGEAWIPKKGTPFSPPHIKRWRDHSRTMRGGQAEMAEGRLGAHIMGGMSVSDLATNSMLQIQIPDLKTWTGTRSERRHGSRTIARIRAGSDGIKPVWVEFPIILHRPFPADARIKAAWLACRYVGTRWQYQLQVQFESSTLAATSPAGTGTAAIDLCWRRRDQGIRIAYLCDDSGTRHEILMPSDIIDDLNAADKIKGHADNVFDEAREALDDALGALTLPPFVARRFEALRQWKSPQRFAAAVTWWHSNRFTGDEEAFTAAWTALARWRHLYQYQSGIRTHALARRKKYYEDIALRVCQQYANVVLGDFDMRPVVELDKKAAEAPKGARHNRHAASPSEFRLTIKSTARRLGTVIEIEDCANATLACSACGHEHDLNPFIVEFRCESCQTPWDRGHNHCENLLKRASGSVPPRSLSPLAPMFPRASRSLASSTTTRSRRKQSRSRNGKKDGEKSGENTPDVENLAQEVEA